MINFQRISEITREYWENDPNIQALIKYLKGDKFKAAWTAFVESEEVDNIVEWMQTRGVDAKQLSSLLTENIFEFHQSSLKVKPTTVEQFSLATFEREVRNEIKQEEMDALIDGLISDGNDFAHLYLILKVSKTRLEHVFRLKEIQDVINDLTKLGINFDYFKTVVS